uniref:uncharacterized protein n=1 Tax=Semicossyphus pulcher TaxID=241346 RepID=UPI0037E9B7FB
MRKVVISFDKMKVEIGLILTVTISSCLGAMIETRQRDISCADIKTAEGFEFSHGCHAGSQIYVYGNETLIAFAKIGIKFDPPEEGININNDSFFTRHCQGLQMKCITSEESPNGKVHVKESRLTYNVIGKPMTCCTKQREEVLNTPWGLIIGVSLFVFVLICIGVFCWCYFKARKKQHEGVEVQEVTVHDLDQNHNSIGMSELQSAVGPNGGVENKQDTTLKSVVPSTDPQAGAETPQAPGLDCNVCKEGTQPSKDEEISVPDGPSNQRDMHRLMEKQNGRTHGDRGPEDDEKEREPLLPVQRAAIQPSDMTGEAADLVRKGGLNPDQVCRKSPAPDTGVDSAPEELQYKKN